MCIHTHAAIINKNNIIITNIFTIVIITIIIRNYFGCNR